MLMQKSLTFVFGQLHKPKSSQKCSSADEAEDSLVEEHTESAKTSTLQRKADVNNDTCRFHTDQT